MALIFLLLIAVFVGITVGITGVGGILLIPALDILGDLPTHVAMATTLFSFILASLVGTASYQRMGLIKWRMAIPLTIGGVVFSAIGASVNVYVPAPPLNIIMGSVILFAGLNALRPPKACGNWAQREDCHTVLLLAIGGGTGFVAGLTGVGGPVLSIPIMIILGFPPAWCVAMAMPYQIGTAAAGSISNAFHQSINLEAGLMVSVALVVGIMIGARIVRYFSSTMLRISIAVICLGVGAMVLVRAVGEFF